MSGSLGLSLREMLGYPGLIREGDREKVVRWPRANSFDRGPNAVPNRLSAGRVQVGCEIEDVHVTDAVIGRNRK